MSFARPRRITRQTTARPAEERHIIDPDVLEPREPGLPLPPRLRAHMEALQGTSFDDVRVHVGDAPLLIGADGFACGADVYLSPEAFDPSTPEGHRVLAHELAHVAQAYAGRLPRGQGGGALILDDPALEAEADAAGDRAYAAFARFCGAADPIGAPLERSLSAAVASSVIQRSVLRIDTKRNLRKALQNLVAIAPPAQVEGSYNAKTYAEGLVKYLKANPLSLSGEKLLFRDTSEATVGSQGSLLGRGVKPGGKMSDYIVSGTRVDLGLIDRNDWKWIQRTILSFAKARYYPGGEFDLVTPIVPVGDWHDWSTTDCFFAAVLRVLGQTFDTGETDVETELDLERRLAEQLGVPGRIMPDEVLIFLMETRFKWKRMPAKKKSTLEGVATKWKWYLLSYCTDEMHDAWHIVLAQRTGSGWSVVDRQAARKEKAEKLPAADCDLDAWEVDDTTEFVTTLKTELGLTTD